MNGLEAVNDPSPVERDVDLFVTIAKTARVARFIRSSTAVKISSKVNWYLLFNLFNPFFLAQSAWRRIRGRPEPEEANEPESSGNDSTTTPQRGLVKSTSWSKLGILVSLKRAEEEAKPWKKLLHAFGLSNGTSQEWRRQLAATKIQRTWRKVLAQRRVAESEYGEQSEIDVAWKGRSTSAILHPMEKAMQKKSMLAKTGPPARFSSEMESLPRQSSMRRRNESQVGTAMRELTGQRVAIGIIAALVLTAFLTYTEEDSTRHSTMIVLHNQTANPNFANRSLDAARASSIPDLFEYEFADGSVRTFALDDIEPKTLRDRERLRIQVRGEDGGTTVGHFSYRKDLREDTMVLLLATIFILLTWFFGVTAFAGPVMILVVIPIERMIRLLGMLMLDPLGYQSTSRYKKFVTEEDEITKNTKWTKEILKGMETSFLMSTILRIGSLMKVGFGSAGVEIIRNNLEKGQSKNTLILNSQGSTVSCIFLFCDIRQFTDATECLQEEVFVFTNRIAAVVHSICHSFGGSANKNVGDAFLLSWRLDDEIQNSFSQWNGTSEASDRFTAKNNQADKALLSVVRICMALHHDNFYVETMSDGAREALRKKVARRKGPVVQMGFGLHAGRAVQGAIGSQRKIDATYVSEAVERAEFLEASTKKYGVKMLMSDSFHRLLHPSNRRRCRKVDQIIIMDDDDEDEDPTGQGETIELLTFDMDIDALWKSKANSRAGKSEQGSDTESATDKVVSKRDRISASTRQLKGSRRRSVRINNKDGSDEFSDGNFTKSNAVQAFESKAAENDTLRPGELVLPTGPALYNANVWVSKEMRAIRELFSDGIFFQKFNSGLQSYYKKDWEHARQCFTTILERFEDGPSRYFFDQIEKHNGQPPRDFGH